MSELPVRQQYRRYGYSPPFSTCRGDSTPLEAGVLSLRDYRFATSPGTIEEPRCWRVSETPMSSMAWEAFDIRAMDQQS